MPDLNKLGRLKTDVYVDRYQEFRNGVSTEPLRVEASSEIDLSDVTFAFVCVDKGVSRKGIFEVLMDRKIPFIDVGMGLGRKHGPIVGMLRSTYLPADLAPDVLDKRLVS